MRYRLRLWMIVCACILFWTIIGALLGLPARIPGLGLVLGLLFGLLYIVIGYMGSEKFALTLYDAKLLERRQAPRLYEMIDRLTQAAPIKHSPLIYLVPFNAPNAFVIAGRRGEFTLAITDGLTRHLEREEVRAVLAVLVARVAQGIAEPWSVASALAGLLLHGARSASVNTTLGDRLEIDPSFGLTTVGKTLLRLGNLPCAALLRLIYDPAAVLAADQRAAQWTNDPPSLASALIKIESALPKTEVEASSYRPSTALLFIVPPLPSPELLAQAPPWLRTFGAFPGRFPTPTKRADSLTVLAGETDAAAA